MAKLKYVLCVLLCGISTCFAWTHGTTMPTGALGIWYMDAHVSSPRQAVPNDLSAQPISANLIAFPRRQFVLRNLSSATVVDDAVTCPDGTTQASTLSGTGASWHLGPATQVNLAAGTYTLAVNVKSNTGGTQTFRQSFSNGASVSSIRTATTSWQRFAFTASLGAGNNTIFELFSDGTNSANLQICDSDLFAGSSDLGAETLSGHLYLGANAFDTAPAYSGGAVDLSSGGQGQIQFGGLTTYSAFTAIVVASKVVNNVSSFQTFLAAAGNPGNLGSNKFAAFFEQNGTNPAPYSYLNGVDTQTAGGLWNLNNNGYHMIADRFDGSVWSSWVDDVRNFQETYSPGTASVDDFQVGIFNGAFLSGYKIAAMALYPRALTQGEMISAYSTLSQRVKASSIVVQTPPDRVYVGEGDSITFLSDSYCYQYGLVANPVIVGGDFAESGNGINDLIARAPEIDATIPANKNGRKFILSVLIGHNDQGMATSTFINLLSSYLDARRAAGWIVVLCTELPSTVAGFNTWRNTVDATISTWAGVHADAIADFASDPMMGCDACASNATLYLDGIHPTTAGHALLAADIAPVINGL